MAKLEYDETGRLLATLRTVMDLTGRPLEL